MGYVFDEKSVSWSHLSIWTPSEVSKAFSCCERALPMRHRDINFLNLPWTMSLIFQFAKSLLSEKIRNRFKTHSSLDSLQRSVDPAILPAEYGGTKSIQDCITSWKTELEQNRNSLLELDQLKIDNGPVGEQLALVRKESRHDSGSGSQVLGMMGNMRKLELDQLKLKCYSAIYVLFLKKKEADGHSQKNSSVES